MAVVFQSTLSMRRATPTTLTRMTHAVFQSTLSMRRATIFPKKLHKGNHPFQSTLSMRRATNGCLASISHTKFQSTLSMRRATYCISPVASQCLISIHALHEESDGWRGVQKTIDGIFQSTLSMRRATRGAARSPRMQSFQSTLSMRRATVQLDIFVRFLRRKPAA